MHAALVWICFQFLFPSLKTHQNELWVSENENKKKSVFELWKQSDGSIFVNIFIWWAPLSVSCLFLAGSNNYQWLSSLLDHLFSFFFFFFLFLFSSQATLFSPYPSTINTTHYSHNSSLPLQLKLKSSFCSVSVSAVGLVVPGCGLSSRRHRRGSRLGIYEFMFVCLREFVLVVFGLWERGKKNLKFGVGKRENMGYG